MSALALPSVTAPATTSVPQGPAGAADATGFETLLATCLDNDAAQAGAEKIEAAPANDDAVMEVAPVETGLVAVPVALPFPPVAPPAASAIKDETASATETPAGGAPELDPSLLPQAASTPPSPVLVSPTAQAAPVRETAPAVSTDAPASRSTPAPKPGPGPAPAAAAAAAAAPAADAEPATDAKAAAGAVAAAQRTPQTAPQPSPPPLRALAERTSRPPDTPATKTADTPASGSGATEAKTGAAGASPATGSPAAGLDRPTGLAAAAPRPSTDPTATSDEPSIDAGPAAEGATASSSTVAHAREAGLSGLSRATIDATAQIAAQILRKLEGRSTRFEMALTPDHLGRVDVKLDIDSEGRLAARLAFDNPAAATDLRGRVDELRRELEEAGFHLADDAFEFTERDSGSSGFDRGQDARHGQNRAFAAASRLNAEIDVAQPPGWMALTLSPAGVDLKV